MLGIGIVELFVLFGVLPLLGIAVGAYLLGTARRAAVMDEQLARARRHQVGVSVLAGAAALVTMPLGAALTPWLGQSTVLPVLPSLMVVAACAVLWVGEVTFPRPTGLVRSTVLNPRGLSSVIPRGWLRLCVGLAALDLVLFVAGALTADGGHQVTIENDGVTQHRVAVPRSDLRAASARRSRRRRVGCLGRVSLCYHPTDHRLRPRGRRRVRRASGGRVLRWLAWGLTATAAGNLLTGGASWQSAAPSGQDWPGAVAVGLGVLMVLVAIALPFVPVARLSREPRPVGYAAAR